MKITAKQICEMAELLDSGLNVYLNLDTMETRSIIDLDDNYGYSEPWEEELKKIEREWKRYIVIENMDSTEWLRVMEEFVDVVDDSRLKTRLANCLARKRPFANFKAEIDYSPYRQNWFDFKQARLEEYVKNRLELENIAIEY